MSGIYGIVHLDDAPVEASQLAAMGAAMAAWGPDAHRTRAIDSAGFGQCLTFETAESEFESLPAGTTCGPGLFTADGRLDNRDELLDSLEVEPGARARMPDGEIMRRAYDRWGADCPARLLGDWSLAAWHPEERRAFVARDHFGNTSLYFAVDGRRLAFASDRRALLALPWVPQRLDELYLAQMLVSWRAHRGTRTIWQDVRRLPPAHTLRATSGGWRQSCYWRLEDAPDVQMGSSAEYAEGLREHLRRAVQVRLRTTREVASTLSGGLDSGAVTVMAARQIEAGRRLLALTAVPLYPVAGRRVVTDERELAALTAQAAPNVEHQLVDSSHRNPIQGLCQAVDIHGEPGHAAGNYFWLLSLLEAARHRVLLTGQFGNAGLSWGRVAGGRGVLAACEAMNPPLAIYAVALAAFRWARRWPVRARRLQSSDPWRRYSAIAPAFAQRLGLSGLMAAARYDPLFVEADRDDRDARLRALLPGQHTLGAIWAELSAASGVVVRDPTQDVGLLTYCLGVPEAFWRGPMDRWLIRQATQGLLPERVRLAHRRGLQAADVGARLRAGRSDLEGLLAAARASALARQYLDLDRLDVVARQALDGRASHFATTTILMRGLSAARFLTSVDARVMRDGSAAEP